MLELLFGDKPYITDPVPSITGPLGTFQLSPSFFATVETAMIVAKLVQDGCGFARGSVNIVEERIMSPMTSWKQNVANWMIIVPDGSHHVAGLVAQTILVWQNEITINEQLTEEFHTSFVLPKK